VIDLVALHTAAAPTGSRLHVNFGAASICGATDSRRTVMRKNAYSDQEHTRDDGQVRVATSPAIGAMPIA
jgi:hypothetical protein